MKESSTLVLIACAGLLLCSCGGSNLTISNDSYLDIRDIRLDSTSVYPGVLSSYSGSERLAVEPGTYTVTLDVYEEFWDEINLIYTNAWNRFSADAELRVYRGLFITINNSWSFNDVYECTRIQ